MEQYITRIDVNEVRHLSDISIPLNNSKRMHLLLTGKNGSGKTSLLLAIKGNLSHVVESAYNPFDIPTYYTFDGIDVYFSLARNAQSSYYDGSFLLAYYGADRKNDMMKGKYAEDVTLERYYAIDSDPGKLLLKYLVHLKTQQAYARNENDHEIVEMLDQWFQRFTDALRILFDNPEIELKYDYRNYEFKIVENSKKIYGFDQLSDGYSAALRILADLILRMEHNWLKNGTLSVYDAEGIVLIDELETHLHIGLQRTILPFLTTFFPRLQFIITTHSPYILNSINNCVVYDLEKNIRMEDLSMYSAEGIVEGYFEIQQYSKQLSEKLNRYRQLAECTDLSDDEKAERGYLYSELSRLSGDLAKEAKAAFEDIEDRRKTDDKI